MKNRVELSGREYAVLGTFEQVADVPGGWLETYVTAVRLTDGVGEVETFPAEDLEGFDCATVTQYDQAAAVPTGIPSLAGAIAARLVEELKVVEPGRAFSSDEMRGFLRSEGETRVGFWVERSQGYRKFWYVSVKQPGGGSRLLREKQGEFPYHEAALEIAQYVRHYEERNRRHQEDRAREVTVEKGLAELGIPRHGYYEDASYQPVRTTGGVAFKKTLELRQVPGAIGFSRWVNGVDFEVDPELQIEIIRGYLDAGPTQSELLEALRDLIAERNELARENTRLRNDKLTEGIKRIAGS